MKLGFVSAILPDLSLEELVGFAAEAGYQAIEVMCWPVGKSERRYAGVTHIDVSKMDPDDVRRVRDLMGAAGVEISGLGYYPNPLTPDRAEAETYIAHIRKVVEAAQALAVPVVNTFIGMDWHLSVEDNWPRFLEVWPPLVKFAEDHGVKIAIENCPMSFTRDEWPSGKNLARTPAIWRRMFEAIPTGLGLNYDPSHLIWQQMDYLKPIREFASRIYHVHAKDARLDRHRLDDVGILATPNEYHTPKLPGLGDVQWGRFFAELCDIRYNGPVCVEVEDRAYEGSLETRKGSLRQCQRYLSQFMA